MQWEEHNGFGDGVLQFVPPRPSCVSSDEPPRLARPVSASAGQELQHGHHRLLQVSAELAAATGPW